MLSTCKYIKRAATTWTIVGLVNLVLTGWLFVDGQKEKAARAAEALERAERLKAADVRRVQSDKASAELQAAVKFLASRVERLEGKH